MTIIMVAIVITNTISNVIMVLVSAVIIMGFVLGGSVLPSVRVWKGW
jgi:hypothetical protein